MNAADSTLSRRPSNEPGRLAVFAGLILLIALLLVATNVQLWRLVDRQQAGAKTSAPQSAAGSTLPAPVSGTSNDVLSKRLSRLSKGVTTPLHGLSGQLTPLQSFGTAQQGVSNQLAAVNRSIRRFGAVRKEMGQMTNGIEAMVASTNRMSEGLHVMGTNVRATQSSMAKLLSVMTRVEGGIAETGAATKEASAATQSASLTTAGLGESMKTMVQGISQTNASTQEMTAGLGSINQTMGQLLKVMCQTLGKTSGPCVGTEEPEPEAGSR